MKRILVASLFLWSQLAMSAGRIQNEDVKSLTELTNAGGTAAQLINDTKIYVTANGINSQLSSAITSGQLGGGSGGVQFLSNGDFEVGPTTSWTLGSGVSASADTTNYVGGKQSASLTLSATNGDIISQDVTKAGGGINLEHTIWVNTTLTNIQACAKQASNEIQCQAVPSTGNWVAITFNSVSPSSGTVGIKVKSTSSATGTVKVDTGYLGTARNIGAYAQASFYGGIEMASGAAGCIFTENTSTGTNNFVDLGTGSNCPAWVATGNITAQATNDHRAVAPNMQVGGYQIVISGHFNAGATGQCIFRLSDGTNVYQPQVVDGTTDTGSPHLIFYASYTTSASRTFKLQAADNFSSDCRLVNSEGGNGASWKFYRFPNYSEQVASINTTPAYFQGYHDDTCSWSLTSTTFADYSADASCAFSPRKASNIVCTSTGSVTPAISCTFPKAGDWRVCANFSPYGSVASGHAHQLLAGSTQISTANEIAQNNPSGVQMCGTATVSSITSPTVFKIQSQASSGTNVLQSQRAGAYAIEWEIQDLAQVFNASLFAGGISSNSTSNSIRHETATVNCTTNAGSSTVISQSSSSFLNSPASTYTATGQCTYTFGTAFSSTPWCQCTARNTGNVTCGVTSSTSASQVQISGYIAGTTQRDDVFNISCTGFR